jgi:hypothetical protein
MIKIDVAPVSVIAILAAIVIAFKYQGNGLPHKCKAVAAIDGRVCQIQAICVTFDVTTVMSSLARRGMIYYYRWGPKKLLKQKLNFYIYLLNTYSLPHTIRCFSSMVR